MTAALSLAYAQLGWLQAVALVNSIDWAALNKHGAECICRRLFVLSAVGANLQQLTIQSANIGVELRCTVTNRLE